MIKPRYALIDLSTGLVQNYPISEEYCRLYVGGKILGARIVYDEMPPGIDPLSPESVMVINTGPLTGTGAPASSRFNTSTKNVLTGGIASSNCGGTFGAKLRRAGFDGLVIRGRANVPSLIEIIDGNITIKDATELWGLDTEETQHRFDQRYGTLVIGPAGENLVHYASIVSGERVFGRCGTGAVMGGKNLKALVAYGTQPIPVYDRAGLKQYSQRWVRFLQDHPGTGDAMPRYGTASFVNKANASGILPTRNFQRGSFEGADLISGETLAEEHLTRNFGCVSCPIRCGRRVMVKGKEAKGPEFETIGLLGSNIENSDLTLISEWNYVADMMGIDTMSLAGTLAFVMELAERGIKDYGLRFGDFSNITEVIEKIARREGEFSELADGSKVLAEKYGGKDFAINSKGLELASYEPRKSTGQGLGYATANRGGCHLNGGYLVFMEAIGPLPIDPVTPKGKAALTVLFQNGLEAVSAGGSCLFSTLNLIPKPFYRLTVSGRLVGLMGKSLIASRFILNHLGSMLPWVLPFNTMYLFPHSKALELATGLKMTLGRFLRLGERGYNLERMFNIREGLNKLDDSLPARLTKEPLDPKNRDTIVKLDEMLPEYYSVRGWTVDGIPSRKKLKQLEVTL